MHNSLQLFPIALLALLFPLNAAEKSVSYPWQNPNAEVTPSGDLVWAPKPFVFHADSQARYIDYAAGDDKKPGTKEAPWKYHPWDAAATDKAAASTGVHCYVFKGGVTYCGVLEAKESGTKESPIRLTRDPAWGEGEAVISGAQAIKGGWKRCDASSAPGIPMPEKCWYQDIGTKFVPRALWAVDAKGVITRIPIARTPHWQAKDPNDPRAGWREWTDLLRTPTGAGKDGKPIANAKGEPQTQAWAVDANNLTQPDPSYYEGATLWTEYIGMMGTPYAQIITKYDPDKHALAIKSCWDGDDFKPGYFSYEPVKCCRYYLENLPKFLNAPGEYYFSEKGATPGRLFLRLQGDEDPNQVTIQAAKDLNLINIPNQSHIEVSGLTFRFENVWPWEDRFYKHLDVAPACIRMLGSCSGIRVANCRFDHVAEAIRTTATSRTDTFDEIEACDNDIAETDHGGITFTSKRSEIFPVHARVLRNRLFDIGFRPIRGEHSVAIEAGGGHYLEIAGNIIDRAYGSGFMIWGGWGSGKGPGEIPCLRMFVHHNKVTNCLLATSDWGAFDVWKAGGFVYNNIAGNPVGEWYFAKKNGQGCTQGFAFYTNGPISCKYFFFNNVSWGRSNDINDPCYNFAAFFSNHMMHAWVNNTSYRFAYGVRDGLTQSPIYELGNLWVDINTACYIDLGMESTEDQRREHFSRSAFSKNVYIGKTDPFWKYSDKTQTPSIDETRKLIATGYPVAGDIGAVFPESPSFRDAGKKDFRPVPNSPAIGAGVKWFIPYPLNHIVGEWKFHSYPVSPDRIRDDHFQLNDEWGLSRSNTDQVRHDLVWQGDSPMMFVPGPLEDWADSALELDGKSGFCAIHHDDMQKDITDSKNGKVLLAGTARRTPDMGDNNFLIEAVFRTAAGLGSGVIVGKGVARVLTDHLKSEPRRNEIAHQGVGYALVLDHMGRVRFLLRSNDGPDNECSRSSAVVVNDGQWHHVIAEADRTDAQGLHVYVDGKLCDGAWSGVMSKASLSNSADLVVGKDISGAVAFLRISQGTLRDAETSIGELYTWEFDGPFLRDFMGSKPVAKRDAGAFQHTDLADKQPINGPKAQQ